jgi:hypothetical protein
MLASDIALSEFRADGTDLLVSYNIAAETAPAFNVSVFRSSDGLSRDELIATREVTLASDRAIGAHTINISPDFIDVKQDYRLIAVADWLSFVTEIAEDNNHVAFGGGAFRTRDGILYVHGKDAAETVRIDGGGPRGTASDSLRLSIDDWMMDYHTSTVQEIHLRLHGGDDMLNVQPQVTQNLVAYAGAGNDRILAGAGSDWLVGGPGDDFIAGRGNRDLIHGDDDWQQGGNDTLLGGADNDTIEGLAGNDKLIGGSGLDIASGGDGDDIVDGGNDDDLVWSGKGRDRIVNPPGRDEPRDARSGDTILATTPEELIFAELAAEEDVAVPQDASSLQDSDSAEASAEGLTWESYGFSGTVGPLWMEPVFGNTTWHAEGIGSSFSFSPFVINREDQFGAVVDFELGYGGAAAGSDLNYKQTSVSVGQSASVEIRANDDDLYEGTEDFSAYFSSAIVPSDPGAFVIVDYPSTGQPSTDPDGDPFSATAYIVDGELTSYDSRGLLGEAEEESGAFLQVGERYPLDIVLQDWPNATDDYVLAYPSSIVVRHNGNVFPSGSVIPSLTTVFEIEAVAPVYNAIVSLDWTAGWNGGMVDRVKISAGLVEATSPEGDVVLVNDQDADYDGLQDYVDGFDNFFANANDDIGTSDYFMPLVINIKGDAGITDLTFSYSASDPRAITATLNDPYILPAGKLRLWITGGDQARSGASVSAGGDYIAPGSYTLAQLGLLAGYNQTLTLYVEGIRESTAVGDASISIETTLASGLVVNEEVDLTAVRFELVGRGYGDSYFEPQDYFVSSHLLEPNKSEWEAAGIMRGSYQSYKVHVYDPRPAVSQVFLSAYALPLTHDGYKYTTNEFIFPQTGSDIPSALFSLVPPVYEVPWQFNPGGARRIVHPEQLNDWDADIAAEIVKTINGMVGTWPTEPVDDGAFGREVHNRVSSTLRNRDGWLVDVWFEADLKTIAPGPGAGRTQVDFLQVESGYSPNATEILDTSKVNDLYDIKTGLNGAMTVQQRDRLTKILNGGVVGTREIKVAMAPQRWTNTGGWKANVNYGNGLRMLSLIGFASAAYASAHAMFTFDEFDPDFVALVDEAKRIQKMTDPQNKRIWTAAWVQTHVGPFLSRFSPDSAPIDFGVKGAQIYLLGQIQ